MKLPSITVPLPWSVKMPPSWLAAMTLPAPAPAPPIVLPGDETPMPQEVLPRATVPVTSAPMKLPETTMPVTPGLPTLELIETPMVLPEMTLRASVPVPPIRTLWTSRVTSMPSWDWVTAAVPDAVVPMKFPSTRWPLPPWSDPPPKLIPED